MENPEEELWPGLGGALAWPQAKAGPWLPCVHCLGPPVPAAGALARNLKARVRGSSRPGAEASTAKSWQQPHRDHVLLHAPALLPLRRLPAGGGGVGGWLGLPPARPPLCLLQALEQGRESTSFAQAPGHVSQRLSRQSGFCSPALRGCRDGVGAWPRDPAFQSVPFPPASPLPHIAMEPGARAPCPA